MPVAPVEALDKLRNRADLVAADLEIGDEVKAIVHGGHEIPHRTTTLLCLWRFLVRREVTVAGKDFRSLQIRTDGADFDLAPRAVLLCVGRGIRQAVLRADLRDHLVV